MRSRNIISIAKWKPSRVDLLGMFDLDLSSFFVDADGRQLVDRVLRFENIDTEFNEFCSHIGVRSILPKLNGSSHASYREYDDETTKAKVARRLERDIDSFKYAF